MAFPTTPLPVKVELDLVGDWSSPTDISSYVRGTDDLVITRGKSSEGSVVDPSSLTLTLNNRDGRFSPRNPLGAYFGSLTRNTPIRVSTQEGSVRAYSSLYPSGQFSTPDSVANSITGDIDLRYDMRPQAWRFDTTAALSLFTKDAVGQRSWHWELSNDGLLRFFWWDSGAVAHSATSTVPVPFPITGRKAIRVTLDVNNGAAGNTVTFYYSDTIAGSWTQLGDAVVQAGTTSIFDGTAQVLVRCLNGSEVYAAQVRNGIAGAVVLNPDFTSQAEGTTSFSDSAGATWTAATGTSVTNRRYRFYGEVASWPVKWDPSGQDVYVQVQAAGILRRLQQQGTTSLRSTIYRGITSETDILAYWPAEDGENSTVIGAGLDHAPMKIKSVVPNFASFSDFACSAPIPVLNGSKWIGDVPPYTSSGAFQVRFLMAVPAGGDVADSDICTITCSGTARYLVLTYKTGGGLQLRILRVDGTVGYDSGSVAFGVNGALCQVTIEAVQNGAAVDFQFAVVKVNGTAGAYTTTSITPVALGVVEKVEINTETALVDTAIGHVYVQNESSDIFDLQNQLNAFVGESAGTRFARLATEEGIPVFVIGDSDDSSAMGTQSIATLYSLLSECADADQGLFYEPRGFFGLGFITHVGMGNQDAMITLDYDSGHLTQLDPTDDDQNIHNDVTVSRTSGSSYRATLDSGALSILDPPNGVGRYIQSLNVNVQTDQQLPDLAGWALHLGTVDEPRFPTIDIRLERAVFVASTTLINGAIDTDVGHVIALTDLPSWLPPDLNQFIRGYTESMSNFKHEIVYVGEPASPLTVMIYDDLDFRLHSDGSTLNEDLTTTETDVDVATPSGPLWSHADGNFDIIVGGERMTVTAISGSTSPQTFTVTRSVNGIVKTHSTGETVDLFQPSFYSF